VQAQASIHGGSALTRARTATLATHIKTRLFLIFFAPVAGTAYVDLTSDKISFGNFSGCSAPNPARHIGRTSQAVGIGPDPNRQHGTPFIVAMEATRSH